VADFVLLSDSPANGGTIQIRDAIIAAGHTCTIVDDDTVDGSTDFTALGYDCIAFHKSNLSTVDALAIRAQGLPTLVTGSESFLKGFEILDGAGANGVNGIYGTDASPTTTHDINDGYSVGTDYQVFPGTAIWNGVVCDTVGPPAGIYVGTQIQSDDGTAPRYGYAWAIEKGELDCAGNAFEARCVCFGWAGQIPTTLTTFGTDCIGNAADWLATAPEPSRPSITSVTDITSESATVNVSAFNSPSGKSQQALHLQVRKSGLPDWVSLTDEVYYGVVSSGEIDGMVGGNAYQVRARYQDDDDAWGEWSLPYWFETEDDTGTGPFSWDDHAQMWNIGDSRYFDSYLGPGGWAGPLESLNVDTLLCGETAATPSSYVGKVGTFGRLLGPPSVLANTDIGPNNGANVAGLVSWFSFQGGFSWQTYNDCELARAGVAALVCGTCEPTNPAYAYQINHQPKLGDWPCTDDMQGVVAYINPAVNWPFHLCTCFGDYLSARKCYFYGLALAADLHVDVYFQGERVKQYTYALPWNPVFSSKGACAWDRRAGTWIVACRHFPWYGIRLKVWHDYDADPTGKTHRIQAAVSTPDLTRAYTLVNTELLFGRGQADLPPSSGDWVIDETWEGGNEETNPGQGDGGLYCGWTGYMGDRWTGVTPNNTWGGTVYKNLSVQVLDETHCDTPCDANYLPPPPPPNPLPTPSEIPFLSPCPPDKNMADKEIYLGGKASPAGLFKFGGYEVEAGRTITARIHPNPITPQGVDGECLFKNIVVVCEHFSDISISIVPILNGERLDAYAQEEIFIGPGDRSALRRYLVPLYRQFEDAVVEGDDDDRFRHGLRGTFLTFEMEIVDLCGIGLQLPGVWVEYEVTREAHGTGVVYTQDLLREPAFVPSTQVFMGTKGHNRLLKADSGVTDDTLEVQARMIGNPVAPEGAGGECQFKQLALSVKRWNANDMELLVTPYIDGTPLSPITVTYKATTGPVREITEIALTNYYRPDGASALEKFRHNLRGAWFHVKIETGSGLQEWLSIEGLDLDYDPVQRSLYKDLTD